MTKILQKRLIGWIFGKSLSGWLTLICITILAVSLLGLSCRQNVIEMPSEEAEPAPNPAVITGHILNSQVYPKTTEISIEVPFYNRVADKMISAIFKDRFASSIEPYGPRLVSIPPFIDHLMIRPGDSIHVELDFSNLGSVVYSGDNADNNYKLNEFFMKYYNSNDWPSFRQTATDRFADECKKKLQSHLTTLKRFEAEMHPNKELKEVCKNEIEAGYFSALIQGLLLNKSTKDATVSKHFQIKDAEYLFDAEYLSNSLFNLSSDISLWLLRNLDNDEIRRMNKEKVRLIAFFNKATKNERLRQMLLCHFYNQLLEANKVELFEQQFAIFNKNVTDPLLKLQTRNRYLQKKHIYKIRVLSNAILNADKPKEGLIGYPKENEGLRLLRQLITKEKGRIIYIAIGASWCPGSQQELPFLKKLAANFQNEAIRFVNFWIDNNSHNPDYPELGIENYYLTDAQRTGLDPIFHLGRGIPFYILIDKDGVIVDYGEHLRPSFPDTQKKLEELVY